MRHKIGNRSINKREEIFRPCIHRYKHLLGYLNTFDITIPDIQTYEEQTQSGHTRSGRRWRDMKNNWLSKLLNKTIYLWHLFLTKYFMIQTEIFDSKLNERNRETLCTCWIKELFLNIIELFKCQAKYTLINTYNRITKQDCYYANFSLKGMCFGFAFNIYFSKVD